MTETVRVETKSPWYSKVNWTQVVGIGATALTIVSAGNFDIPAEQQVAIVAGIQSVQSLATWIFKTYYTKTVLTPSLPSN